MAGDAHVNKSDQNHMMEMCVCIGYKLINRENIDVIFYIVHKS